MTALGNIARYIASHPMTRSSQVAAWTRVISWQIRSRLQAEVIVPWIDGQKLAVRHGMTGATGNIYAGLHEFADMMLPLHFLCAGDLFLDIGANVGSYTVLAAGVRRARTWAFEPGDVAARQLRRNIEINGLGSLVTVHEIALGDHDGEAPFTVGLDTMNRVAANGEADTRMVVCRRLDGVIGAQKPVMMKLDVEGFEKSVLWGARELLRRDSLAVVTLETVTPEMEGLLASCGFARCYYDPFTRTLQDTPGEAPTANTVFVRNRPMVAARLTTAPAVNVLGRDI